MAVPVYRVRDEDVTISWFFFTLKQLEPVHAGHFDVVTSMSISYGQLFNAAVPLEDVVPRTALSNYGKISDHFFIINCSIFLQTLLLLQFSHQFQVSVRV
jgi:hypothetical protein